MKIRLLLASLAALCTSALAAGPRDTIPDTRAATGALGRVLPMHEEVGTPKRNRTVGLFYFNWHTAFWNPGGR